MPPAEKPGHPITFKELKLPLIALKSGLLSGASFDACLQKRLAGLRVRDRKTIYEHLLLNSYIAVDDLSRLKHLKNRDLACGHCRRVLDDRSLTGEKGLVCAGCQAVLLAIGGPRRQRPPTDPGNLPVTVTGQAETAPAPPAAAKATGPILNQQARDLLAQAERILDEVIPQAPKMCGSLEGINICELVQVLHLSRQTACIKAINDRQTAQIFVEKGDLAGATLKNLAGEEAFIEVAHWPAGSFVIEYDVPVETRNIDERLDVLLVKALRPA